MARVQRGTIVWIVAALMAGCAGSHYRPSDPNEQFEEGMTMLMVAAANGDVDQARALLAAGADPNLRASDGRTALMLAVMQEHVEVVRLLLDAHADPDLGMATVVPNWEVRPLWLATMRRNEALAELLKSAGGELGQSQGSPAKTTLSGEDVRP